MTRANSSRTAPIRAPGANTFVAVADEWLMIKKRSLAPGTWQRDHDQLHKWVVPHLGNRPIASIEAPDLLDVLRRIEAKGISDTAHRTLRMSSAPVIASPLSPVHLAAVTADCRGVC